MSINTSIETEILLMEYACGALDEIQSLLISSYLSLNPDAEYIVRQCEALGGYLMEQHCDPIPMHETSLEIVMGRLNEKQKPPQQPKPLQSPRGQELPDPISAYINDLQYQLEWVLGHQTGIQMSVLPTRNSPFEVTLIDMAPGIKPAHHSPNITEISLVLGGAFRDDVQLFGPGHFIVPGRTVQKRPVSDDKDGCFCISVTSSNKDHSDPLLQLLDILLNN